MEAPQTQRVWPGCVALGKLPSQARLCPLQGEVLAQQRHIPWPELWLDSLGLSGDLGKVQNKFRVRCLGRPRALGPVHTYL